MSADNYYIVRTHPKGGFTYVMGFASDDNPDLRVCDNDPRFATLHDAIYAVRQEYALEAGGGESDQSTTDG